MRKFFCFIFLFSNVLLSHAQFKASKDGVIAENGGNFYVAEIKGKTAKELFDAVEAYVIANFKNPDAVSNSQEGKMINIHGVFSKAFKCRKGLGKSAHYADVELNIIIYFKDGKIRFDAPIIHSMICHSLKNSAGESCTYHFYEKGAGGQLLGAINMFNENGEIKDKVAVDGFNTFINEFISSILEYVTGEEVNGEW